MLKKSMSLNLLFLFTVFCALPQSHLFPVPTARQLRWAQAEFGVIFHYDLHVFDGKRYDQAINRIHPVEDYNMFNPNELDTDQWIKAAKAAGARFAVITATHETGFAIYQSNVNPYSLKALKWRDGKGDVVGDFVKSCRKYGIQPGVYIGIRWNSLLGIHNFKAEGESEFARNRQEWYRRFCERMTEELMSKYGDLFMVWYDGGADDPKGLGPDVEPIVNRLQPECLFYHNTQRADFRWGGSEAGTVGYPCWSTFPNSFSHNKNLDTQRSHVELLKHGDPDGKYWVPAMADAPLRGHNGRHEWFWEPGDEDAVYPLKDLVDMYYNSVGRNATLILGLTPDSRGLVPEGDVQRLKEFGDKIDDLMGHPLKTVAGNGMKLEINLGKRQPVNQVVIQEEISNGERVRAYVVQGLTVGGWKTLCEGESVGHKRIQTFKSSPVSRIRLLINESIDVPQIKNFSVYCN
ncbi:alpha-L-fucosidase [Petrimonas sulfuriphila]|uniref:alpha-L-fucosidase n=1 Tax=Petrimonas sulfuriphila TaxID=285070 RepID=UPI003EBD40BD